MREEKNNENAQFFYSKINFRYIFCVHSEMIVDRSLNKTVNVIAEYTIRSCDKF